MARRRLILSLILLLTLAARTQAKAYPVAMALPLDKLAEQCDLIVKVQTVSSEEVKDAAFPDYTAAGFGVFSTKLKVISVIKGDATLTEISFHHYDDAPKAGGFGRMFMPQVYRFAPDQCYILFAKKTDDPAVFNTFSFNHTSQHDQGLMRCADATPPAKDATIQDVIRNELKKLVASKNADDVTYAISYLDTYSGPPRFPGDSSDNLFKREEVLDTIAPLLASDDVKIADSALATVGRSSPYLSNPQGWLATVGKGNALRRGWGTGDKNVFNSSTFHCRKELIALANSSAAPDVRGQAIRALGRSRENEADTALLAPLRAWTIDEAAPVRAAAAILWSDYPSKEALVRIHSLAADPSSEVRTSAAYSIGCSQLTEFLSVLDRLLDDEDEATRHAAAISLMSFDTKKSGEVLKGRLKDQRYFAAFVNTLAEDDPRAYADELAAIITSKPDPSTTLTGQMADYTAWLLLKKYIDGIDVGEIRHGKLDKYLDALESPPNIGSGPYQDLYRFYHDNNLQERMNTFREKAIKQVQGYDVDQYFKQIDGRK